MYANYFGFPQERIIELIDEKVNNFIQEYKQNKDIYMKFIEEFKRQTGYDKINIGIVVELYRNEDGDISKIEYSGISPILENNLFKIFSLNPSEDSKLKFVRYKPVNDYYSSRFYVETVLEESIKVGNKTYTRIKIPNVFFKTNFISSDAFLSSDGKEMMLRYIYKDDKYDRNIFYPIIFKAKIESYEKLKIIPLDEIYIGINDIKINDFFLSFDNYLKNIISRKIDNIIEQIKQDINTVNDNIRKTFKNTLTEDAKIVEFIKMVFTPISEYDTNTLNNIIKESFIVNTYHFSAKLIDKICSN